MLALVVGTRPQHIKLASLIRAFDEAGLEYSIIHTGQHYDFEMDKIFFEELGLPKPIVHLGVGSGSHGVQTGLMLMRLEENYLKLKPKLVVVPGDTNSALAGGLAAVKLGIPVAHVEAGLRSRIPFMAEEINRVVLDHISQLLFAPTEAAYQNLIHEGIDIDKIYLTGDVMADNIMLFSERIDKAEIPIDITPKNYIYVTIHRAENVDNPFKLKEVVEALTYIPQAFNLEIVFPIHPRTRNRLIEFNLWSKLEKHKNIHLLKPVSYFTSLKFVKNATIVLTDSGGLQKEAFLLGTPAITLRETTEWVETVEYGWNTLVGTCKNRIIKAIKYYLDNKLEYSINPIDLYGGGKASKRIAKIISQYIN